VSRPYKALAGHRVSKVLRCAPRPREALDAFYGVELPLCAARCLYQLRVEVASDRRVGHFEWVLIWSDGQAS